ncbi:para-aminobenzoate synthetase / 4-amino-4-deoxychorismate lyase [Sphingomonas guangdongensis]|uniref:Probable branched-chain-amino-acid aminotransferase n=1 Tax=Sphingomonas guangdongensis TaxID=1141890 RepID=A0A285QZG9_9SPHN|nr:aminodeoxychorismate synthase component I [Sphingomonas guangdongensis]SOB86789.1 para-aminobenzoate synthetase / 4-amino-4-deoxychorismate lyase [Sphingomonas guangdongensis]
MLPCDAPFALLDDARADGGVARLYRDPTEVLVAHRPDEVAGVLAACRRVRDDGLHVAGFLGYEAGLTLEPRLDRLTRSSPAGAPPLAWFGVFPQVTLLERSTLPALLPDPRGCWTGEPRPRIDYPAYARAFDEVAELIRAGDIYQANLSYRADLPFAGHPLAIYARLRTASAAGWGGIVHTGAHWLLSASPELFFTLAGDRLIARPMKGTAPRGATPAADAAAVAALKSDEKERAENLMIVDLLRNDLSRVAVPGSVHVPALFTVESYPTLHTLTSTITADLAAGCDAVDVLAATFPCGSVTGAPKIRAMEVIAAVEADSRGPYTGSLGYIDAGGDAAFNVAIRTLVIDADVAQRGHGTATLGLGSAVVADSTAAAEWEECRTKARFAVTPPGDTPLIETMRFEPDAGVLRLERHLARLARSAAILGYQVDGSAMRDVVGRAVRGIAVPQRVRLTLMRDGIVQVSLAALPALPAGPVKVSLSPLPVDRADLRLRHKTGDRAFYDDARAAAQTFEVAFVDPDGFLTEGSFTNLFVPRGDRLATPPESRGLLPGILRDELLASGQAVEADLTPADLAEGFYIGNALRGLIPARLV